MTDALQRSRHRLEQKDDKITIPMSVGRLGAAQLLRRVRTEIADDHVGAFAGSLAYHGMLAIFPFLIFVVSVLGIAGADQLLTDGLERISYAIPADAQSLIVGQIDRLTDADDRRAFTIGAVVSALVALWAVSGAMRSTMEALNVMYEVSETRSLVRRYLTSVVLAVGTAAAFLTAITLVVAGPAIAREIAVGVEPLGNVFVLAWSIVQWPVLVGLVLVALAMVYYVAPDVGQDYPSGGQAPQPVMQEQALARPSLRRKFRLVTPGSVIAAVLWLAFSLLFALYVNNLGSYNATYGTLAGLVVLILYLYYSAFLMLVGAQINQTIEQAHPAGKDEGERR